MVEPDIVARHYDQHALTDRIAAALTAAGLDGKVLAPKDLAPLDQFHSRGLAATAGMAKRLGIVASTAVLDLGSGLGGPSRYLAATYGCHVTGVDLSPSFVEAATYLAERAGLADKVAYQCADALSLPFPDASFEVVWTQHVAMNIADRAALYAECLRVLRPAGRLAIYDVVAGDGQPLHYPVPWSRGPETSVLLTPDVMHDLLEAQGFRVRSWIDDSEAGKAWFDEMRSAQAQDAVPAPSPLGLHLVMGPEFREMAANLGRNLMEGRVGLVEVILERS